MKRPVYSVQTIIQKALYPLVPVPAGWVTVTRRVPTKHCYSETLWILLSDGRWIIFSDGELQQFTRDLDFSKKIISKMRTGIVRSRITPEELAVNRLRVFLMSKLVNDKEAVNA